MANKTFTFLFVIKNAASITASDQEIVDRLERIGATVTLKSEDDTFIDTDANWETFDGAGVSETV